MKDLFPEYYDFTFQESDYKELWDRCYFILDTNILLKLYDYKPETQNDIFNTLEKFKERLWIPHHVALEYQKKRKEIIENAKTKIFDTKNSITTTRAKIINHLNLQKGKNNEEYNETENKLISLIDEAIKLAEEVFIDNLPKEPYTQDSIRDRIDNLFQEKVGPTPTQSWLDEIYKEGEERYPQRIPPGFCDDSKDKKPPFPYQGLQFIPKYGDLIIWKQILQQVQSNNSMKYVILIINDNKKDWWWTGKNKEKFGPPRRELTKEIMAAGVSLFYMYTLDNFLQYAKDNLNAEVKDESIKEIKTSLENGLNTEDNSLEQEEVFSETSSPSLREAINGKFEGMGIPPREIIKEINNSLAPVSKVLAEYEKSSLINSSALGQLSTNLQELCSLVKSPVSEVLAAQEIIKKINGSLTPISAMVEQCEKLNQNNSRVLGQLSTNFTQLR